MSYIERLHDLISETPSREGIHDVVVSYVGTNDLMNDILESCRGRIKAGVLTNPYPPKDVDILKNIYENGQLRASILSANNAQRRGSTMAWSKLFARALKQEGGWKLTPQTLSVIANQSLSYAVTVNEVVDITKNVDWNDGEFGKSRSCWWTDGAHRKYAADEHGFCMRFWKREALDRQLKGMSKRYELGIGRVWLWATDEGVLCFNLYYDDDNAGKKPTLRPMQASYLVRTMLDSEHLTRVKLYSDTFYINDNNAILVSDETCSRKEFRIDPERSQPSRSVWGNFPFPDDPRAHPEDEPELMPWEVEEPVNIHGDEIGGRRPFRGTARTPTPRAQDDDLRRYQVVVPSAAPIRLDMDARIADMPAREEMVVLEYNVGPLYQVTGLTDPYILYEFRANMIGNFRRYGLVPRDAQGNQLTYEYQLDVQNRYLPQPHNMPVAISVRNPLPEPRPFMALPELHMFMPTTVGGAGMQFTHNLCYEPLIPTANALEREINLRVSLGNMQLDVESRHITGFMPDQYINMRESYGLNEITTRYELQANRPITNGYRLAAMELTDSEIIRYVPVSYLGNFIQLLGIDALQDLQEILGFGVTRVGGRLNPNAR